ncbi:hypothetical protein FOB64_000736 [Candida albicans]|uniref:Oxidant-induced cell-cycle arrest protein 5 n=1 Tax=Candida albicans TaxID=5476 RepID=A0A8H6C643_CANAX|nr:hypothetical protein FOB64_000736 [Candida albicans]
MSEDSSPPPPLPARKSLDSISIETEISKKLPDLPSAANANQRISFDLNDSVSQISAVRQWEIYTSLQLNETSDIFVNNAIGQNTIRTKLNELKDDHTKFWIDMNDYSSSILLPKRINKLEEEILTGIPSNIRETFSSLLTKSRQLRDEYIESLAVDSRVREILIVFNYYVNEITNSKFEIESDENSELMQLPISRFIINVCILLGTFPEASQEDVLYLLLKFNKLYTCLNKDEFFYKVSRSLEEGLADIFKHISVQGINLNSLFRSILVQLFSSELLDEEVCLRVLDFVVFEGFDFVLRSILYLFRKNLEKIQELDGDALLQFLNSPEFCQVEFDFKEVLAEEPSLIQYENEFYLINANSMSNNSNELTNLKEVNDELVVKINDLKRKIDSLQATHSEISDQSEQYTKDLSEAEIENQKLLKRQAELQEKYQNLTMAENLSNTIKANQEFSQRNFELESQIKNLQNSIEEKNAKLAKVQQS